MSILWYVGIVIAGILAILGLAIFLGGVLEREASYCPPVDEEKDDDQ